MTNSENQESSTNVALLLKALTIYKKGYPKIEKVWMKSDNAGTYHSEQNIVPLWTARKSTGIEILGYKFTASGDGKSVCDG